MKIGVFDSGVGGLSVANAIEKALPDQEVILKEDKDNVPYGTKSPELLFSLVLPILQSLEDDGCSVIVVACNTVSTTIINELRGKIKATLIAIEPMVKPAAEMTKTSIIAICATPTTLASPRYAWLKEEYAKDIKVLEPDCSDWAYMIEHSEMEHKTIESRINNVLNVGADVIVLGCTHYHWIEEEITELSKGRALVLQPEQAIIKQLKAVLEQPS